MSGCLTSVQIVVLAISALPSGFKEQKPIFFSGCVIPVAHFNNGASPVAATNEPFELRLKARYVQRGEEALCSSFRGRVFI